MSKLSAALFDKPVQEDKPVEHSVQIRFPTQTGPFGSDAEREAIHRFSDQLADAIDAQQAGEFDGDEFGEGGYTLFMYGPDADRLYAAIEALLPSFAPLKGGEVIKRYGPPGAAEQRLTI